MIRVNNDIAGRYLNDPTYRCIPQRVGGRTVGYLVELSVLGGNTAS